MYGGAVAVDAHPLTTFGAPRAFSSIGAVAAHAVVAVTVTVVALMAFAAQLSARVDATVASLGEAVVDIGGAAHDADGRADELCELDKGFGSDIQGELTTGGLAGGDARF